MAKETTPNSPQQTPFERFTEAARQVFNLPPDQVKKIIKATPSPNKKKRRKRS